MPYIPSKLNAGKIKLSYVALGTFFILAVFFPFMFLMDRQSLPIIDAQLGGWEDVQSKISAQYPNNEELKNAALQMGFALQRAVDDPRSAQTIDAELNDGMSCVLGVLVKQKISNIEAAKVLEDIRDLVVFNSERQQRYIRFNGKLNGTVLTAPNDDLKKCKPLPNGATE